jgi:murein DD-endopeptidase MepM/ murein hydrolase activator NlpD
LNREKLAGGLREGQELVVRTDVTNIKQDIDAADAQDEAFAEDQSDDEEMNFLPRRNQGLLNGPKSSEPGEMIFPVEGRLSSKYGKRGRKFHKGIDIAAMVGTPMVAAGDGEVIFSGRQRGYGSTIVIDHGQFMTLYAHASKLIAKLGDRVSQGDFIAKVGRTGNARGAHLHFELRNSDNKPIDPLPYLRHKAFARAKVKRDILAQQNAAIRNTAIVKPSAVKPMMPIVHKSKAKNSAHIKVSSKATRSKHPAKTVHQAPKSKRQKGLLYARD